MSAQGWQVATSFSRRKVIVNATRLRFNMGVGSFATLNIGKDNLPCQIKGHDTVDTASPLVSGKQVFVSAGLTLQVTAAFSWDGLSSTPLGSELTKFCAQVSCAQHSQGYFAFPIDGAASSVSWTLRAKRWQRKAGKKPQASVEYIHLFKAPVAQSVSSHAHLCVHHQQGSLAFAFTSRSYSGLSSPMTTNDDNLDSFFGLAPGVPS